MKKRNQLISFLIVCLFSFLILSQRISALGIKDYSKEKTGKTLIKISKENSITYDCEIDSISSMDAEIIQELITNYLYYSKTGNEKVLNNISPKIITESENRRRLLLKLGQIDSVIDEISTQLQFAMLKKNGDTVIAEVYEMIDITYHNKDNQLLSDTAAYGVWHEIELKQQEGRWYLLTDSYDESDVTGFVSGDYNSDYNVLFETHKKYGEEPEKAFSSFSYTTTKVGNAINYAVNYCGIAASVRRGTVSGYSQGSASGNASFYNSSYGYLPGIDCANFVSQCLNAAGMSQNSIWYYNLNNANWVGALELAQYLGATYADVAVNSSYSNVYPGNPVYWDTSHGEGHYHQMICVGKNTSGVPVLCGHTTDIYRIPISWYYSSHNIHTIKIATSNLHLSHTNSSEYYYNNAYHYHICQKCEIHIGETTHTANAYNKCTVCGATGPFVYPN